MLSLIVAHMLAVSDTVEFLHAAESNPLLAMAAGALGLLVAFLLFEPFFDDWEGFWECIKFWFTPDVISLFRGEYVDDKWSTLKLFVWFGISIGVATLAYHQLPGMFPRLFHLAA